MRTAHHQQRLFGKTADYKGQNHGEAEDPKKKLVVHDLAAIG
jgi:hypothetical protein